MTDLKMTNAGDYMKSVNFDNVIDFLNEHGLDRLKEEFGIKYSQNEAYPDLYVLNYDQIESSKCKDHPIVKQCRSLVVEYTGYSWRIVSRSFDRFFNEGEVEHDHDVTELTACEKVDGSLVSVFWYEDQWLYRTKSMIEPEPEMKMSTGRSWCDLIESVLTGHFYRKDFTYIFEVVSKDNRVVTRYDEDAAYLLAVRENRTGDYLNRANLCDVYQDLIVSSPKVRMPREFKFDTMQHALEAAKELPNLEEGYVMYNYQNEPVIKVKSPAYVAAHRLRGESVLTPKRIIEMIRIGEADEYLSIFPEDTEAFDDVKGKLYALVWKIQQAFHSELKHIEDQKEYALAIMEKYPEYQGILFALKKNADKTTCEMINEMPIKKLLELLKL